MANKLLKGFLSIAGSNVITLLLGIVTTPLIVRVLNTSEYGTYAFIMSVLAIVWIFVHMGMSSGIQKFISESRDYENWQSNVFSFYFRFGLIIAIVSGLLIAILTASGIIGAILDPEFNEYFYVVSGILFSGQLYYISRYSLMGLHKEQYSEILPVLHKVILTSVGLTLAYIGYGVTGLLWGIVIAGIICSLIGLKILGAEINIKSIFRPLPSEFPSRELLSYNSFTVVLVLLLNSLYHIDLLLLQPLSGSGETGIYKAALVAAEFIWFVPFAIQRVFIHSVSDLWNQEETKKISNIATSATRYSICLTLILAIGLGILAEPFISIYFGSQFTSAITPLRILIPGAIGFAVARPIIGIGQAKGNIRIWIYVVGGAAIINLILNIVLIPSYGMYGAAIATSTGYGLMIFASIAAAHRQNFNPIQDLRFNKILAAAGITFIILYILEQNIHSDLISLLVVPPSGFLVYVYALFKTGGLTITEVEKYIDQLPERIQTHLRTILSHLS